VGVEVVIFDIDGTLLDSADGIVAGFQHALRSAGVEPPDDDVVVVEVYSNSSSAPNSVSSTFLRRPSLSASATPAPTSRSSSFLPLPPLFFFFEPRSS